MEVFEAMFVDVMVVELTWDLRQLPKSGLVRSVMVMT